MSEENDKKATAEQKAIPEENTQKSELSDQDLQLVAGSATPAEYAVILATSNPPPTK